MFITPSYLTLAMFVAANAANEELARPEVITKTEIERIQITGDRMQKPGQIELSTKRLRQPLPAQDGADILRSITGFSSVRKGGASADPVFRGMSGSRLTVLTDGDMTLGGCPSRMDPPTAYITPQAFDYVNLIKGPQAVTHGPMTAAGTVRFERDKQLSQTIGTDGFFNMTRASFGRVDTNIDVTAANEIGYLRGAVNLARSDDYKDGLGTRVHSAYQRWNTSFSMARHFSDQHTLLLTLGLSDGEAAYADRGMDGSRFRREAASVRYAYEPESSTLSMLELQYFYNYVDHVMDNFSLRKFSAGTMSNPAASNPDRRTQGGRFRVTFSPVDRVTIVSGIDGQHNTHRTRMSMHQEMMPYRDMERVADADIEQWGMFIEGSYAVAPNRRWVSGVRTDRWQATDLRAVLAGSSGHDAGSESTNPSFGESRRDTLLGGFVRYESSISSSEQGNNWYAGVGYSERFPDYWELIGGNRQLEQAANAFHAKHETTLQADIGLIAQHSLWRRALKTSTSIFYGLTDDYLLLEVRSQGMQHDNLIRNIGTRHYGMEWDAEYQLDERWLLQASLAYTRATNRTDALALAQQPPLEGRLGISWVRESVQIGGLFRFANRQHRVAPGQGTIVGLDSNVTPSFAVFSLNASWQLFDDWQLSIGIDNLFDGAYAEHLSRQSVMISSHVPSLQVNEPGRTLWINFDYRW